MRKYIITAITAMKGQTNGGIIYMSPNTISVSFSAYVFMASCCGWRNRR